MAVILILLLLADSFRGLKTALQLKDRVLGAEFRKISCDNGHEGSNIPCERPRYHFRSSRYARAAVDGS